MSDDQPDTAEAMPAARGPAETVLGQAEIDAMTGFQPPARPTPGAGMRAMVEGGALPREPLPMLGVVLGRFVERLAAGLRTFLRAEVEVALGPVQPLRYGAFIEEMVLPSQSYVFRAGGLAGPGLVAIGPDLAGILFDSLLGGGRRTAAGRAALRSFTAIEVAILGRFVAAVLAEAEAAFGEVAPVSFEVERTESDPRLAAIARPGDAIYVVELDIEIDGRAALLQLGLPAATLEPIKARLRESFAGVETGIDAPWSTHLASEAWQAQIGVEAVLHETRLPLGRVLDLAVGDTLMFDMKPGDLVTVRCGGHVLTRGRIGRLEGRVAIQVVEPMRRLGPPEAVSA